jgi:hypothetical protein
MRKGNDFGRLLRAGSVFRFRGEDMDAADDIEFRLRVAGGSDLDCVNLSLPKQGFRAIFTKQALSKGDALLAVTQANPRARLEGDNEDCKYHGAKKPRGYTFDKTTPPFLLSAKFEKLVEQRKPLALHFYDLPGDEPVELGFVSQANTTIRVNAKRQKLKIIHYRGDDFALEVIAGTPLVRSVSRMDGEIRMELVEVRTK